MSKRDDYFNIVEESKKKSLGNIQGKTNAVDDVVNDFEKKVSNVIPKQEKKTPAKINNALNIEFKPKEAKSVHKSFLITKSVNDKLSAFAKQTGVSENEIINEILKKAFTE